MKRLTYTFDNGPAPGATERVLDFLAERAIKATFFVVGERLREPERRKLAERAHAEGHWIGNHTMTHGVPLGISGTREHAEREIGETQSLLGALAHPRKFFRPNGGGVLGAHVLSSDALTYLIKNRYTLVTWNNVPRDWEEPRPAWAEKALKSLTDSSWSLVVLHDRHVGNMMDTLTDFHARAIQLGVEIVQDFPPSCVPLLEGEIVGPVADLVSTKDFDAPAVAEASHG